MTIVIIIASLVAFILILCLLFPRARRGYWEKVKLYEDLWRIIVDSTPSKEKKISIWMFLVAVILVLFVAILYAIVLVLVIPAISIINLIIHPESITEESHPFLREKEDDEFISSLETIHYTVPTEDLTFDPTSKEVIYYNPSGTAFYDEIIEQNLEEIKKVFSARGLRFVYLPDYNQNAALTKLEEQIVYARPELEKKVPDYQPLTYSEISGAYHIPDSILEPCLVRCMSSDSDRGFRSWNGKFDPSGISFDYSVLHFSVKLLESTNTDSFFSEIRTYLRHLYSGPLYSLKTKEDEEAELSGKSADERFDDDMYIIGQEIRERIEKLRAKGLSSLAIKKLIGDDSDNPGKLLIDRQNRLILTDYGNKEIKLSPIHKAVFFLFLRHPEGIYFKDLGNYRDELGKIYREITGRDDMDAVEDSINKLTDPYDNSINEKCARIKNAFVSEFREEVAQWYFIDGKKGEKKIIKLPRELVTWEIKD